jgi:hypothetical protein
MLLGASFDDLEPAGTPLARGEVEIVRVDPDDTGAITALSPSPRLVLIDVRSAGERTVAVLSAIRAAHDPGTTAALLLVPALERERWESLGADGIVNRPLTAARLLDALKRHGRLDERGSERSEEIVKIELSSSRDEWTGFTRDLGASGAFVHGHPPFCVGEEVAVRLSLPGDHGTDPIQGRGRVVRVERGAGGEVEGAAVAFLDWPASDRGRLGRWQRDKGRGTT